MPYDYYGTDFDSFRYISHYGVLGMKWGVRRFQNPDGSLKVAGKGRYDGEPMPKSQLGKVSRSERRQDNKIAYELGKKATISGRAVTLAAKKREKLQKKYERNQSDRNKKKLNAAAKTEKQLQRESLSDKKAVQDHHNSLVKKYGSQKVKDIKYDKYGNVNERTRNQRDWLKAYLKAEVKNALIGEKRHTKMHGQNRRYYSAKTYNQSNVASSQKKARKYYEDLYKTNLKNKD